MRICGLELENAADGFVPFLKFAQIAQDWFVPEQTKHVSQHVPGHRPVAGCRFNLPLGIGFYISNNTAHFEIRRFGLNRPGDMGERPVVEDAAVNHTRFAGIETAEAVFPQMSIGELIL